MGGREERTREREREFLHCGGGEGGKERHGGSCGSA